MTKLINYDQLNEHYLQSKQISISKRSILINMTFQNSKKDLIFFEKYSLIRDYISLIFFINKIEKIRRHIILITFYHIIFL